MGDCFSLHVPACRGILSQAVTKAVPGKLPCWISPHSTLWPQVAGEEIEIEEFVDEEGEDTVKHSTKELANRESFIKMGNNLKQKVRWS